MSLDHGTEQDFEACAYSHVNNNSNCKRGGIWLEIKMW